MKLQTIQHDAKMVKDLTKEVLREEDTKQRGSLVTIQKLSDWVAVYNKELRKHIDSKNIREVRKSLLEIKNAVEQMDENVKSIASEMGLPDLD